MPGKWSKTCLVSSKAWTRKTCYILLLEQFLLVPPIPKYTQNHGDRLPRMHSNTHMHTQSFFTSMVGSYSSTKWFWMSWIVSALLPTPPAPTTTSLYSVIIHLGEQTQQNKICQFFRHIIVRHFHGQVHKEPWYTAILCSSNPLYLGHRQRLHHTDNSVENEIWPPHHLHFAFHLKTAR